MNSTVTYGLLAAWALHDAEEILLGPRWLREHLPELRERFPEVPEAVWKAAEGVDEREFAVAVAAVGAVVAAAAVAGQRSGGRSSFYQAALTGFGLHGLVHLAQAAAVRGYTPGSVTSPLIVVPFTLWARGRLRRAGVLRPTRTGDMVKGLAVAAGVTVAAHALARKVTGHPRF
ncbi:HXXEE domain-containing protein [Streptomyces sp. NPDC047971]|uniref:HXXEE domain-containing protein n=1 Tax=Streptomyces sp. NPDC047971 TaxID=3154499 RepID=UPI0033C52BAE